MRKDFVAVSLGTLVAFGASMGAAQDGEQAAVSRNYDLGAFEEVSVLGPHHVWISVGPGYSVRVEGPQETLEQTEVEVEDGELQIHPKDDDRWRAHRRGRGWDRWEEYRPATIHVTLPRISAVSLMGSGDVRVDRAEGDEFSASVAGSGELDLAALQVDQARFSIAGSGELLARGSARRSRISIAGSGNLRAHGVASEETSISIVGSGNAALTVEHDARVSIMGSGDVDIAGRARCSVTRFGSGRVRCGGEDVS